MSGRPTADIVADLRDKHPAAMTNPLYIEAADRLAELEAEIAEWQVCLRKHVVAALKIDALRPPCPTCGGKPPPLWGHDAIGHGPPPPCPDCIDGKVPIERLVKVFEAVHDANVAKFYGGQANGILHHLRGIR